MWSWTRQFAVVTLLALAYKLPAAQAQVQVAPETFIRLNADASVGYVKSSAQGGLNSVNYGLGADLTGHFYHPNFLQFQFSPFYNQGREYSTADFISGDKGFSAGVNLFAGSNIPLSINYFKSKTNSGLYGVIGSESNVVGSGTSDNLNVNWTVRLRRLPSLQLGYFRSAGDYRIFGTNASRGSSHTNGYVLGAQHTLLGFLLTASYTSNRLEQLLPGVFLSGQLKPQTSTDQKNLQFSVSRQLVKSTFFDATANRSRWSTDATGRAQDRNYDTLSAGLNSRPLSRLGTSFRVHYTSDLNALLLGSVLPGAVSNPSTSTNSFLLFPTEFRSRYITYSASGTYDLSQNLSARASFRHGIGRFSSRTSTDDTTFNSGVNYRHTLLGGRLMTGYSLGLYKYENGTSRTSSQGHSGSLVFSKLIRGWDYTGVFQYSTSDIESQLPGNSRFLTTELSSAGFVKGWRLVTSFRYERADTIFNTETENRRQSARVSLAKSGISLSGTMQFGRGLSIVSISGLRPASTAQVLAAGSELERLLIPTESLSYSISGSYQISKRTSIYGTWARTNYSTLNQGVNRENLLDQMDIHVRHWFRKLDCRAGYRRYEQKFPSFGGLYRANTVYFQVSRHFDVF